MREFSLNLMQEKYRPIVKLYELNALIDTGAIYPVFSLPAPMVEKYFDAKLVKENIGFGGFGGESVGCVYSISDFRVGLLNFHNLEFIVPDEPKVRYPIILSASMFWGLKYMVDTVDNKFTVFIPDSEPLERDFKIKQLKNELCVQINDVLFQDQSIMLTDIHVGYNDKI